ncbi:hypothetical protein ACTWP5_16600 [Streptomyces sp. 4N509B]|uniref:hypothetical protein n=1 Tax=Streptomyces sp. 4N509B TaxID=3457413 RepID=UPI003FD3B8C3
MNHHTGTALDTAIPLVIVLGIVTWLLVRSRSVKVWEAVAIAAFGFCLALTPVGAGIANG